MGVMRTVLLYPLKEQNETQELDNAATTREERLMQSSGIYDAAYTILKLLCAFFQRVYAMVCRNGFLGYSGSCSEIMNRRIQEEEEEGRVSFPIEYGTHNLY